MRAHDGADLDTAVVEVLDQLLEITDVQTAGLALTEGGGRRLRVTTVDRDGPRAETDVRLEWEYVDAYDDVPLSAVLRTGESVVGALELLDEQHATFARSQRGAGIVAVAAVPLATKGHTWGGIELRYDGAQRFGPHQLALLHSYGFRASRTIAVARALPSVMPHRLDDGVGEGGEPVRLDLDPNPGSVGVARRFARVQLSRWGMDDDAVDSAVLCLSEMVTNVVVHAGTRSRIELRRHPERVVVTVRDGGAGAGHAARGAREPGRGQLRVHGRGLQLIEGLADEWGSTCSSAGMTVWCSFATSPLLEGHSR